MVLAECTLLSSIGVLVMIGIGNRQVLNVKRTMVNRQYCTINTIVHASVVAWAVIGPMKSTLPKTAYAC